MPDLITETVLPNGVKIFSLREEEVPILYEQIQEYFKNGIELHEGDTIFDVGANIGLFTLWVYWQCHKNVNVYAFEPIPAIFDVLHANAQRFDPQKLRVFPCGLSRQSMSINFAYYPNATPLSNAYPEESKEDREQLKKTVLNNLKNAPPSVRWLRWLPQFLQSLILDRKLETVFQIEQVNCQLRTVSEIIRDYNIHQIDLLKVDVEKSELDVLLGIEPPDWKKIKQVVAEIHDFDGRVEKITHLLKEHGLSKITVEQEAIFKGSKIFNLYALR
ncbi:MAG: FkbM family methyltransferase [Nostoc sp. CreGUA01]|nr:FkbM family methyltransferase [Nostoc sp. CreGUA01]